jgi:hypothetical protein
MTTHRTPVEIFKPLLEQFCKETKDINIGDDFPSIFLPHVMNGYETAKKKIFYFGQDTAGWTSTKELMQKYSDNALSEYVFETSEWINENGYLDYNENKAYGFWTLVAKLHLRMKGVTKVNGIGRAFYEDVNLRLLDDFGYGNTNSIEMKESLLRRNKWDNIDPTKYRIIKDKSKIFDILKHTIEAYHPDLIFIFNWGCKEKLFLEGLNYEIKKYELIKNHFWVVNLPDTKTKIIWTMHPNSLKFLGYRVDELIDTILDFVNEHSTGNTIIN